MGPSRLGLFAFLDPAMGGSFSYPTSFATSTTSTPKRKRKREGREGREGGGRFSLHSSFLFFGFLIQGRPTSSRAVSDLVGNNAVAIFRSKQTGGTAKGMVQVPPTLFHCFGTCAASPDPSPIQISIPMGDLFSFSFSFSCCITGCFISGLFTATNTK